MYRINFAPFQSTENVNNQMQNNKPKGISSLGVCISLLWLVVCVWSTVRFGTSHVTNLR